MTLANDSIVRTPGAGALAATHMISSKEHPAIVRVCESGHIRASKESWLYVCPSTFTTVNRFDLWNATGSGKKLRIGGLWTIPKLDVAIVGAFSTRFDVFRTSAIGTGGTAWNSKSATQDVAGGTVWPLDENNAALPAGVTARQFPTGGATKSRWLGRFNDPAGEEFGTAGATFSYPTQYFNNLPSGEDEESFGQEIVVPEDSGILVVAGDTVIAFHTALLFTLE